MKWRIVAFDHPDEEKSLLYRHCPDGDALIGAVMVAMEKGANLMSIRGFDDEEVYEEDAVPQEGVMAADGGSLTWCGCWDLPIPHLAIPGVHP